MPKVKFDFDHNFEVLDSFDCVRGSEGSSVTTLDREFFPTNKGKYPDRQLDQKWTPRRCNSDSRINCHSK